MKMSRKFITAGVAGVMALGIAVSAWAAEPQITDQKIRSGGVTVNIPVVKGAVSGAEVDDKVNMAIDFNIVKKLYAYLPGGSNGLSLQENYYPEFDGYGGAKASREFVTDIAGFINRQLQNQAQAAHKAGSHVKQYTFDGRYQVRFNSEELLSLEQTYMDYLGGAHPNTYLDTINVNLKNGKLLSLGDMFKAGSNYLPRLNAIVAKQVADEQQLKGFFDKKVEVNGTENFYITDNADLVIVYPPYAVAPYAAGTIEFIIPVSQVADIFNFKLE